MNSTDPAQPGIKHKKMGVITKVELDLMVDTGTYKVKQSDDYSHWDSESYAVSARKCPPEKGVLTQKMTNLLQVMLALPVANVRGAKHGFVIMRSRQGYLLHPWPDWVKSDLLDAHVAEILEIADEFRVYPGPTLLDVYIHVR